MDVPAGTARLRFRRFTAADEPLVASLLTDPQVMRFIDPPLTGESAGAEPLAGILRRYRDLPGYGRFVVERRGGGQADGRFVGWVSLRPVVPSDGPMVRWVNDEDTAGVGGKVVEVGYRLLPAFWGHGLATEAARSLLAYAVDVLDARELVANTMAVNVRSRRVLEKLGFALWRVTDAEWDVPLPGAEEGEAEYRLSAVDLAR